MPLEKLYKMENSERKIYTQLSENYRLPAEWEPQWGVMLTWPHEDTDWKPYLAEITETFVQMAREIARREHLLIVVPRAEIVPEEVRRMERVVVFECPTDDTWARDHGPIVLEGMMDEGRCGLWLDFKFNGWGEKFPAENDNQIVRRLFEDFSRSEERGKSSTLNAQLSTLNFQLEHHQDFVLEGGSIESDGCGTIFTTSQCLLAPNRNQPLRREELEAELKRRLRAERVVWLDHGNLIGDDTDGHIDTIVRCAPNDTLLYVGCDDPSDPHFADFQALEQQLHTLRTTDGRPYRLLKLPMADFRSQETGVRRRETGENPQPSTFNSQLSTLNSPLERLPATYANFLILNGAVLVPTYAQPEKDAEALRIIARAFPDRDIIPLDARIIVRQHGSVHCLTMQLPLFS